MSLPHPAEPERRRILVVDDDPDFREFVRIVLESRDYVVSEAPDAAAGLACMRAERPHLVLLDAMMSYELAGIGMIRIMRQDPELADTPLILISAVLSDGEDRFLPADERGRVDRFLTKPISPGGLLAAVSEVLQQAPRRGSVRPTGEQSHG